MNDWDKILKDFARKCKGGAPDMTNSRHLALLRESLIKFGWNENATNEFIGNLRETKDKSDDSWWTKKTPAQQAKYIKDHPGSEKAQVNLPAPVDRDADDEVEQVAFKKPVDRTKFDKRSAKPKSSKGKYPSLQEITDSLRDDKGNVNLEVLIESHEALQADRALGNAGAGGGPASEGESKYTEVATGGPDGFNNDEYKKANRPSIDTKKKELKERREKAKILKRQKEIKAEIDAEKDPNKKKELRKKHKKELDKLKEESKKNKSSAYPNSEEAETLRALGYEPESDEAYEYLATREVFAEEKLDDIKSGPPYNSVYYKKTGGFGGPKPPRPEVGEEPDPNDEKAVKAYNKQLKKQQAWDDKEAAADKAYKDWMKAAYDGGLETQRILEENEDFDETKPHQCVQSDPELDNAVESHLENEVKRTEEELMDCHEKNDRKDWGEKCSKQQKTYDHYKNEHKLFKENREYHDTYVVGQNKDGEMYIVSISNKKGGHMKDPQNNMTPKGRFFSIKKILGEDVAETVSTSLDEGIRKVTSVQRTSRETSATVVIDDTIVGRVTQKGVLSESRKANINARGGVGPGPPDDPDGKENKRKRRENGKPSRGSEFGCWLEDHDPEITPERWEELNEPGNEKELLELLAKFNGDVSWHEANTTAVKMKDDVTDEPVDINGRTKEQYDALSDEEKEEQGEWEQGTETWQPPYDPFTKTFIKIGEAVKHDRLTKWKQKNPGRDTDEFNAETLKDLEARDPNLSEEDKCLMMKLREQEAVNQAHASVINSITEADSGNPDTRPDNPDGDNGPHTRGYIRSVMESLHFTKYIRMDDKSAEKMLIQMGIHGAKPTDIRDCLAELSGYKPVPPDDPEELIKHLESRCRLNQETTPPSIEITNDDGTQSLMEDTWRSAGTSQKVAAGFGGSMRECITGKTDGRRAPK